VASIGERRTFDRRPAPASPVKPTTSAKPSKTPTPPSPTGTSTQSPAAQGVTVSISAYTAGAGADAFTSLASAISNCRAAGSTALGVAGPNGAVASRAWRVTPAGSPDPVDVLMWRRGDVIAAVTAPGPNSDLAGAARLLDDRLTKALAPLCANVNSRAADAQRSPYLADKWVGWRTPLVVEIGSVGLPAAEAGVIPVPLDVNIVALPAVTLRARPADPVYPLDYPAAVPSPTAPNKPGLEPTTSTVSVRTADPTGPGCGWAFTGLPAPAFDDAAAKSERESIVAAAQQQLVAEQAAWRTAVSQFYRDMAVYNTAAQLWTAYATAVQTVNSAWDQIDRDRAGYNTALTTWETAVEAAAKFDRDFAAASAAYSAAVQACSALAPLTNNGPAVQPLTTVEPTDTATTLPPEPTDTATTPVPPSTDPVPTDTAPTPTTTDSGSPSPTPTPTTTVVTGCPPTVPPILYQPRPSIPPSPTPPPVPGLN